MITILTTPVPHRRTLTSSSGIAGIVGIIASVTVPAIFGPAITRTRAVVEVMMAVSVIAIVVIVVVSIVSGDICIESCSIGTAAVAAVRGAVVVFAIGPSWL